MSLNRFLSKVLMLLPSGILFDTLIFFVFFYVAHRRIPRKQSKLFNDYLFYLKMSPELYSPLRQFVSDKELVKIYYRGVLGYNSAPKTLSRFSSFDELSSGDIPEECVIKPAHLSGVIYKHSGKPLSEIEEKVIKSWFSMTLYEKKRERNYRFLKPSVICEESIGPSEEIRDYKFFCYRGQPRLIQVDVDRHRSHSRRIYTVKWEALPFKYNKPLADIESRPQLLDDALSLASELSKPFEFIRVDMYFVDGRVYLGEMTSVPENAHGRFESISAEVEFMRLLLASDDMSR